ncbi:DUF4381 domain-containing protein [Rhizobium mayense]|uniref:DUF4381 domain-containing protein n=1 Tax=Rhizobium mayense TaxID=1312184 RepID=A0ABT7K237_9HYPH|nr:DUF4381 domain-containing protein [Rhizobium mayense]MDL2402681.1 DUF4381 domain-containing protein [Rhizobium mayense]
MEPQTPRPDPMTETALRSLHDIAMPTPVSWTPQTWGWMVLGLILLAGLMIAFLLWLRHYRANAYRREARRILEGIEIRIRNPETRQDAIQELAGLLKRTALAAWPRDEVASLSGAAWVRFLDDHAEGGAGHKLARLLDDAEYRNGSDTDGLPQNDGDDIAAAARRWIERHYVSA